MSKDDLLRSPSDVVGDRVRTLRKVRGLSVDALAARCSEVGASDLTPGALYLVEGGRRKDGRRTRRITVDELLALAHAFDVSPLALLLPSESGPYAVTPTLTAHPLAVYDWIIGYRAEPGGDVPADGAAVDAIDPIAMEGYLASLPVYVADHERRLRAEIDEAVRWREQVVEDLRRENDAQWKAIEELKVNRQEFAEVRQRLAELTALVAEVDAEESDRG